MQHIPVMINEVLTLIETHSPHTSILDGTLGLGGYSLAFLERFPECSVLGIDRDEHAISFSRERLKAYEDSGRFRAVSANFGELSQLQEAKNHSVYVFDLGVRLRSGGLEHAAYDS